MVGVGVEVEVEVEVSFRLLNPPDVSSFVVRCRGPRCDDLAHDAHVVSAEGDIVLLYITLLRYKPGLYFVYKRGIRHLRCSRRASRFFNRTRVVGILPRGGEGYVVAAAICVRHIDGVSKYALFLYSSKTKAWSTKLAPLDCDCNAWRHSTHKVIAVGGDSLGWVDLWWGIMVCNLTDEEDPTARCIQLPGPMPGNEDLFWTSSARSCRDARD